jgi:RHS repeat-associated protein
VRAPADTFSFSGHLLLEAPIRAAKEMSMLPASAHRSMPTRAGLSHTRSRKTALPGFSRIFPAKNAETTSTKTPVKRDGFAVCRPKNRNGSTCWGSYVDEALLFVNGAVKYYPHANHLYSIAAITDAGGNVVERYSYNAYGTRTVLNAAGAVIPKSTIRQQVGFTGYYLDAETGLYYARTRTYFPLLGRFGNRMPWIALPNCASPIVPYPLAFTDAQFSREISTALGACRK